MSTSDTEFGEAQDFADFMIASMMNGTSSAVAAKSAVAAFFKKGRWISRNAPGNVRLPYREWKIVRERILERDRYVCAYCGDEADCVDHILALIRGGTNADNNLAACCSPCNWSKGGKLLSEWRGQQ